MEKKEIIYLLMLALGLCKKYKGKNKDSLTADTLKRVVRRITKS